MVIRLSKDVKWLPEMKSIAIITCLDRMKESKSQWKLKFQTFDTPASTLERKKALSQILVGDEYLFRERRLLSTRNAIKNDCYLLLHFGI